MFPVHVSDYSVVCNIKSERAGAPEATWTGGGGAAT